MDAKEDLLFYRFKSSVKIGQVERYIITYKPPQIQHTSKDGTSYSSVDQTPLRLKIRNCVPLPKRAAYLMGPYILYIDIRTKDYSHTKQCFVTADQPQFEPNLQPAQSFTAELSCHTIKDKYVWVVDITSQILFSLETSVEFEILVGKSEKSLGYSGPKTGVFLPDNLYVLRMDTNDLWNLLPSDLEKPVHLVVITHGLHSNVGADMLYIKEQIEHAAHVTGERLVVRGYHKNVCKTERGIKYLGMKVADYIINDLYESIPNINKISFIGHSLGGLVQSFAIAYIEKNYPWFFKNVTPVNFITLASPLLGISQVESPSYVNAALSFGAVGRTGQELGLLPTELERSKSLLELLPTGSTHKILRRFIRRTLYANAMNDGIVPLRTSALLFLDYKGLYKVTEVLKESGGDGEKKISKENNPSVLGKPLLEVTALAPEFMSTMSFLHSSNPVSDISAENAQGVYEKSSNPLKVTETLKNNPLYPEIGIISSPDKYAAEVPESSSFLSPMKAAFAAWVAPQGSKVKHKSNENPLPKASVIETAKSILSPKMPSKQYLVDPTDRFNPIIHDKVYTDKDIEQYKNQRQSEPQSEDSVLNPFADNFSNFFGSNKDFERLEESIAMKWHDRMSWRKVLVNLRPDAHNNIIVRRRFPNAYGWLVLDHLVKEHFLNVSLAGNAPEVEESDSDDAVDEVAYRLTMKEELDKLEAPSKSHMKMSPRVNVDGAFQDLDNILNKEQLMQENTAYNYTPYLHETSPMKSPLLKSPSASSPKTKDVLRQEQDWINSKNYNEDSIFEIGPTGILASMNDKISKII